MISIISLLIAMLLPSVEKARASGEQVVCQTNLRQMGIAMAGYVNEWDDWLPYYEAWYDDHHQSKLVVNPDGSWYWRKGWEDIGAVMSAYLNYSNDANSDLINTDRGLTCPSWIGQLELTGDSEYATKVRTITRIAIGQHLVPYAYNTFYLGAQWSVSSDAKEWFYRKKSYIKYPSNIITDGDNAYSFPPTNTPFHYWGLINRTAPIENSRDDKTPSTTDMLPDFRQELRYPIGERHLDGANTVCLDGHADWMRQEKWHAADADHRWRELNTPFTKRIKD